MSATPATARAAGPERLDVPGAASLRGSPRLPGDKSISHRALLLGLLAEGQSRITDASAGLDVRATAGAIARLGAAVAEFGQPDGRRTYLVASEGIDRLGDPGMAEAIDCGNSGTALRLLAGILAGQPARAVLDGDASLRRRPMTRIAEPLRAMGAEVEPSSSGTPPVTVRGRRLLRPVDWRPAVPSAQVKSAILLAGLRAAGTTRVHEAIPTRDHTERMLRARGAAVRTLTGADGGAIVEVDGGQLIAARDQAVPGDPSAAAFWLVAGAAHPDAEVSIVGVGVNPGRRTVVDLLREMGADLDEDATPNPARAEADEPVANLRVRTSQLRAIDVDPRRVAAAIDEIPVLCLAATQASGVSRFRGAGELRVKESDRLAGIVAGLRALGAKVAVEGDDVRIAGPTPLHGADVDGLGDHRLVMTFAIAGLLASGRTTINGAASAAISDPGFLGELERIRP